MKNQIKTFSAYAILADWTNGNGATGKIIENFKHVDDVPRLEAITLCDVPMSVSLLQAIAEYKIAGSVTEKVLDAWRNGFISPNHASQYEEKVTKKSTASSTFVKTSANLTAEQYRDNCLKLGLSIDNFDTISTLVDQAQGVTDKTSKANLLELIHSFTSVFFTPEQREVYTTKVHDEHEAAIKFEKLTASGYTDVRPMIDGRYVANLALENLHAIGALFDAGFTFVGSLVLQDGVTYQITFKDIAA